MGDKHVNIFNNITHPTLTAERIRCVTNEITQDYIIGVAERQTSDNENGVLFILNGISCN